MSARKIPSVSEEIILLKTGFRHQQLNPVFNDRGDLSPNGRVTYQCSRQGAEAHPTSPQTQQEINFVATNE